MRIADIRRTDIGQIYEISLYHVFLKSERHMPVAKIIVFCNNIRYNFSEKRTYLLWMLWIRMIDREFLQIKGEIFHDKSNCK